MNWSELPLRVKIIIIVLLVVGLLAGSSAIYNWYFDKPALIQDRYEPTKEIKKAKKIEHKKIIVASRIDVLDKDEATKKLKINK
jgi:flagellar basal body-associated protein FliL